MRPWRDGPGDRRSYHHGNLKEALIEAAQEEGTLNVIALPPDWANYGEIIDTFAEKYDIEVNSDQPTAASQDEINAATQLKGTDRAPDVFDLGQSVALANTDMFASYQVSTFDDVPAEFKDPDGAWINDYGGFMSVGYDSSKVPEVTSLDDLPALAPYLPDMDDLEENPG